MDDKINTAGKRIEKAKTGTRTHIFAPGKIIVEPELTESSNQSHVYRGSTICSGIVAVAENFCINLSTAKFVNRRET